MDRGKMFSYHQWASMELLKHIESYGEEVYHKKGVDSFPSIQEITGYTIGVEKLWLNRMLGQKSPAFEDFDVSTPEKAVQKFMLLHAEMELYFASLTEQQWMEELEFTTFKGDIFRNTREEMHFIVVNQASYHRGQIISLLRQYGKEDIPLDYIHYQKQNR